jgi:hypothetical protein
MLIEIVSNEEVAGGLVAYVSSIITSQMGRKLMGSQVSDNVSIPRIIDGYGEQMFIWIIQGKVLHTSWEFRNELSEG